MLKRLTATVLAASLVLTTAFTAPARAADSGEIARAVLGAGVLLYLNHELSKQNHNRRYVEPRSRKVVPASCLRNNEYRDGPRQYLSQHCLSRNMRHYGQLPGRCQTEVYTSRGWRTVYSAHCLREHGWRIA